MKVSERLADILRCMDDGVIGRSEVNVHVGFMLVEFGSAQDVLELPPWIRQSLVKWARGFDQTRTWWLVSSSGERDASREGLRLLALIKEAGLFT